MSKYKIFKNKRAKYHPSIHIEITEYKKWKNIEITSSPTKTGRYGELAVNPNPNITDKKAWFRKYIRKDPISARGEEFANYKLSEEDEKRISEYIESNKKVGNHSDKGAKRLNRNGNQANHRFRGQTPSSFIKSNKRRNRKRKRKC